MRASPWWLQMRRSPGGHSVIRSLLEQLLLALQVLQSANITHRSVPQALIQRSHSWHLLEAIAERYLLLKVLDPPPLSPGDSLGLPCGASSLHVGLVAAVVLLLKVLQTSCNMSHRCAFAAPELYTSAVVPHWQEDVCWDWAWSCLRIWLQNAAGAVPSCRSCSEDVVRVSSVGPCQAGSWRAPATQACKG